MTRAPSSRSPGVPVPPLGVCSGLIRSKCVDTIRIRTLIHTHKLTDVQTHTHRHTHSHTYTHIRREIHVHVQTHMYVPC